MKWEVQIPKPNAKRLKIGMVVVSLDDGWNGAGEREYPIEPNDTRLEFEISDNFEYVYNATCRDGATFNVRVEYSNEEGTRNQVIKLVPSKCI